MQIDLFAFNGLKATATSRASATCHHTGVLRSRQRGRNNGSTLPNNLWRQEKYRIGAVGKRDRRRRSDLYGSFNTYASAEPYLGLPQQPVRSRRSGQRGDSRHGGRSANRRSPGSPGTIGRTSARWNSCKCSWLSSSQLLANVDNMAEPSDNPYANPTEPFPTSDESASIPRTLAGACWSSVRHDHVRRSCIGVLEYLGVPSPFVGTETWANPTWPPDDGHPYHPPFNRISAYREPGKINLNTIYTQEVFNGLMDGDAGHDGRQRIWADFVPAGGAVAPGRHPRSRPAQACRRSLPTRSARSAGQAWCRRASGSNHDAKSGDQRHAAAAGAADPTRATPLFNFTSAECRTTTPIAIPTSAIKPCSGSGTS